MKRSKAYKASVDAVKEAGVTSPLDALKKIKEASFAKFDETVEVHFKLGIDPRHADQQLRGTLVLPHGSGRSLTIAVLAPESYHSDAQLAGADYVGDDDLIEKIQSGWLGFDLLIATPDVMRKLGKLGKVLGSKGLMPNPKSGTVTKDVGSVVKEFKSGKIEYRNDKQGLIHVIIGKCSFSAEQLYDNFSTIHQTISKAKPAKSKGTYMQSIALCSTMGPSVFIETLESKWKER
ncbi:50S ribosomal protein L1 [Candidatus Marinamargulisbacteria bacterium]|nr:50S ribosomal protein L1 [bacterium]MDA7563979.1 50S ribosomal protein L1 [Candidatus Marinamargulisbacteria bacterium]